MADKVTYFTQSQIATVVWNPDENVVLAVANGDGIYALTDSKVIRVMRTMGFTEVTPAQLKAVGITDLPEPDLIEHKPRQRFEQA